MALSRQPRDAQTGTQFEEERLLSPRQAELRQMDKRTIEEKARTFGKMGEIGAFKEAIFNNPLMSIEGSESDPEAQWLNEVHYRICDELGLEDWSHLKVYPTLGQAADISRGVDVLFVYVDPQTHKSVMVTADLTINPEKIYPGLKADLLISDKGAISNLKYQRSVDTQHLKGFSVQDLQKSESKAEDDKQAAKRRQELAKLIAKMITYKLEKGDLVHGTLATRLRLEKLLGRSLVSSG